MEDLKYPLTLYFAMYRKPGKRTWTKTRWRTTPEGWAKHFGDTEYQLELSDTLTIYAPGQSSSTGYYMGPR